MNKLLIELLKYTVRYRKLQLSMYHSIANKINKFVDPPNDPKTFVESPQLQKCMMHSFFNFCNKCRIITLLIPPYDIPAGVCDKTSDLS